MQVNSKQTTDTYQTTRRHIHKGRNVIIRHRKNSKCHIENSEYVKQIRLLSSFWQGSLYRFNRLKTKRICFIQGLSAYRAVNPLHRGYKNQSADDV
jgi:hypothetical protein